MGLTRFQSSPVHGGRAHLLPGNKRLLFAMFQSSPVHGGRAHWGEYPPPPRGACFNPRPSMADGRTVCFKKAVFSAPYSMYFANPAKRAPKSNPLHYSICSNYLKFKHRESPLIFQMLMVRAALGPAPLSALYHKRFFIKQHSLGRTVFLHATVPRFGQAV